MYQSTYSALHRVLVPHPSSETADNTEVFYHHLLGPLWNSFPSSLVPTMGITSLDVTKDRLDEEIKKKTSSMVKNSHLFMAIDKILISQNYFH